MTTSNGNPREEGRHAKKKHCFGLLLKVDILDREGEENTK